MSWYIVILLIVLSVIFYIAMWSITTIAFTRWAESSDAGWIVVGAVWPLVLACAPFVAIILFVNKIVEKYGYKEESK